MKFKIARYAITMGIFVMFNAVATSNTYFYDLERVYIKNDMGQKILHLRSSILHIECVRGIVYNRLQNNVILSGRLIEVNVVSGRSYIMTNTHLTAENTSPKKHVLQMKCDNNKILIAKGESVELIDIE